MAGAYVFEPVVFGDERGTFASPYQEKAFVAAVGRPLFPVAQASRNVSQVAGDQPGSSEGLSFSQRAIVSQISNRVVILIFTL